VLHLLLSVLVNFFLKLPFSYFTAYKLRKSQSYMSKNDGNRVGDGE